MSLNLSEAENASLGAFGGVIEVSLMQSLNYLKNAKQQGLPFTMNPRVLYRGFVSNCLNFSSVTMFQFAAAGKIKAILTGREIRTMTASEQLTAGALAGISSALLCSPMELLMIQQQRKGGSLPGTLASLIKKGVTTNGITRGMLMTAGREGIFAAGYLGVGPIIKEQVKTLFPDSIGASEDSARFFGSIAAGLFACYFSHPMDTIKTCMQGDIENKKFTNVRGTLTTLWKEGGIPGLYRGAAFRCSRQIACAFILDKTRCVMGPVFYPDKFHSV